jgi:hypothetical protein
VHVDVVAAVVADARVRADPEFTSRRFGHHAQRAAVGVASEQRALRPLEHFDALEVEERRVQAVLAAEVDAVDVHADALLARGLIRVERHDAADPDRERRLARFERRDAQARNGPVGEIEHALDVAIFEAFAVDHGDRDRRLLEVGIALVALTMISSTPLCVWAALRRPRRRPHRSESVGGSDCDGRASHGGDQRAPNAATHERGLMASISQAFATFGEFMSPSLRIRYTYIAV